MTQWSQENVVSQGGVCIDCVGYHSNLVELQVASPSPWVGRPHAQVLMSTLNLSGELKYGSFEPVNLKRSRY